MHADALAPYIAGPDIRRQGIDEKKDKHILAVH